MMMDINKVEELHTQVADLLRNEQLLAAFDKMKALVEQASDWNLSSEYENQVTTYQRMLGFIAQDMADPDRGRMYYNLITKGLILNDRLYRAIHTQVGTTLYYKCLRDLLKIPHWVNLYDAVEWVRKTLVEEKQTPTTEMQHQLFNVLWTSDVWSPNERQLVADLLVQLPEYMAALCVSAVTMGFMEMYDPQKYLFLFDAYLHPANVVNQRAVVGIALGCLQHDNRMRNSAEIRQCVESFEEIADFKKELQNAQMHILRSRETEKINKFMNEEFIPEMLKNPILKKDKTGLDSLVVEDGMNPEWEKWIESKDVKSKMNIMNQLYTTGADIHMASFANMKNFPFFREISNWFLPFDSKHPSISLEQIGEDAPGLQVMQQMIEGSEFCDSDCYSLYLFLTGLPQSTRQMMGKHVPVLTDEMREQLQDLYARQNGRSNICKKYVQNVYRFYKLFSRKHEFVDVFEAETNLQYCDLLQPLVSDSAHLHDVAMFLFSQKHYEEAEMMYSSLEMLTVPNCEVSQKRGFCMQQLKRYDEAIEQYENADALRPDNLWNLTHLAQCYNYIGKFEQASYYYLKAEAIAPDDLNLQLQTGNCLAKLERYDEAFKRFFKVHYLDEKSVTVWRAIAWYSLMAGKMEQAERFYQMIEAGGIENSEGDLLNMGHMYWVNRSYAKATAYYRKCFQLVGEETFRELILSDADSLLLMNVSTMDIPLILDLVKM